MLLHNLLKRLNDRDDCQVHNLNCTEEVSGVCFDSRVVQKRNLLGVFTLDAALATSYITQALSKGVSVFLVSETLFSSVQGHSDFKENIWIVHKYPRRLFGKIVGAYYGDMPQTCIAITGTAGKTSVSDLVRQLWDAAGRVSASIGTLGLKCRWEVPFQQMSGLTSPDAISLHQALKNLRLSGINHLVMEASSHGIDQGRCEGVEFSGAAFTSFSQDHLDYHVSMETYFQAKLRLFEEVLPKSGWAVLNADIPEYKALEKVCIRRSVEVLSYGKSGKFLKLNSIGFADQGMCLELIIYNKTYEVLFKGVGRSQVENLMCALAIVLRTGVPVIDALNAVLKIDPIPGRLEFIGTFNGGKVYLDYAHKPGALESILTDLRFSARGQLHCVFGCGGDRDTEKRAVMGRIANELSDRVIITDDNPRSENSASIRKQILSDCPKGVEIPDRKNAIEMALSELCANDVLVIAGKGHETYQIIAGKKIPFSDKEVVAQYIYKSNS